MTKEQFYSQLEQYKGKLCDEQETEQALALLYSALDDEAITPEEADALCYTVPAYASDPSPVIRWKNMRAAEMGLPADFIC